MPEVSSVSLVSSIFKNFKVHSLRFTGRQSLIVKWNLIEKRENERVFYHLPAPKHVRDEYTREYTLRNKRLTGLF